MKLSKLLLIVQNAADRQNTDAFLCGGVARDKVLGTLNNLEDLDITTGNAKVQFLAKEVSMVLGSNYKITSKTMDDGHVSIFVGNIKIDFSSNFVVPDIKDILLKKGIENPTDIQKEMFSRDFTCNSLLLSLNLKDILDPTGEGLKDIEQKVIRTCLDCNTAFSYSLNRIIRAIYLSSKLGFRLDNSIIEWIKKNKMFITKINPNYLSKHLNKAIFYDKKNTIYLIKEMDLWDVLPIPEEIMKEFNAEMLKSEGQLFTNYDYVDLPSGPGTSPYSNLKKYKSISDFKRKNRNRRKKNLKKIIDSRLK